MSLPEDYDFGVDIPATIKLEGGKILRIVGAVVGEEKQAVFFKAITEEEYLEEMGIEEDE